MAKNLKQYLVGKVMHNMLTQLIDSTDPSCFGDPLAERTEWTPLTKGGANFQTHKLVSIQNQRMEFRSTIGNLLFSLVFLISGIFAIILAIKESFSPFLSLFGLVFAGAGTWMLYSGMSPIVFDKNKDLFWKGREKSGQDKVSLRKIHALQLVTKRIRSSDSSYSNYELNIILQNLNRVNVISYSNKNKIRRDAEVLAKFLVKPLWDAIDINIFDLSQAEAILRIAEENPELLNEESEDTRKIFDQFKKNNAQTKTYQL